MTDHTLKAALDLLFALRHVSEEADRINNEIYKLDPSDDFHPRISPAIGQIEKKMVDMLDLYFEDLTGWESLAEHMLYETGVIHIDESVFNLKDRKDFEMVIKIAK